MSDSINPLVAAQPLVQAVAHLVGSEDAKEFTSPARQKAKECLAQAAGIVFGLGPVILAPAQRQIIKTNSQTQMVRDTARSNETIHLMFLKSQEEVMQEIANRITQNASEANIQPPPLYIAALALEAMRFAQDEPELRRLYVNLLASSMNKETVQ